MPVICPTCQISLATLACRQRFSFKSLRGRCGPSNRNRLGLDGRRRAYFCDRLLLNLRLLGYSPMSCRFSVPGARLCDAPRSRPRCGPPDSPRTRDRGPRGKSNQRTGHRAHGPQNDRSRHGAQCSISSPLLSARLKRNKRSTDQYGNKQFFHRDFLAPARAPQTFDCGIAAARRTNQRA